MTNVIKVNPAHPAAQKIASRASARSRTLALAVEFDGRPVEDFAKAWEEKAFEIHGPKSKHTARGKAEQFSGWLRFFTREGIIKVVETKPAAKGKTKAA
jgi:hypothetical protein